MFGLGARFRKSRPDRLTRLATAIDALTDHDQRLIDESHAVDKMRITGAMELYAICRKFVDDLNERLAQPAVLLSPVSYAMESFDDTGSNLFQINLRGRLLQLEFSATDELYERDDFRIPYTLRGAVRSFSQEFLDANSIVEQAIYFCPNEGRPTWFFFDGRTYRTGVVGQDYLAGELERLL